MTERGSDRERASRNRKSLVIFIGVCAIVVIVGNQLPNSRSGQVEATTPMATAYVVDLTTPMEGIATQTPVDYGQLAPESTQEQFSPFSPEVQLWAKKAEEWSQLHSQGRVPPKFILSLIEVESKGNPNAGYPEGDSQGLFQIWEKHLETGQRCAGINPYDPDAAASCAIPIMDESIQSATRNGQANFLAAGVGYHLPEAVRLFLGEETAETFVQRMNGLGHNGNNLLESAGLFALRIDSYLVNSGLR